MKVQKPFWKAGNHVYLIILVNLDAAESGSGSGFRIRIWIHWPDWIRIQYRTGSGSETVIKTSVSMVGTGVHTTFPPIFVWLVGTECCMNPVHWLWLIPSHYDNLIPILFNRWLRTKVLIQIWTRIYLLLLDRIWTVRYRSWFCSHEIGRNEQHPGTICLRVLPCPPNPYLDPTSCTQGTQGFWRPA